MAANTSQPLDHSDVLQDPARGDSAPDDSAPGDSLPHDSVPGDSVPHDIETVFRQKGIPLTRQRAIIWEFFAGADRAATIAEATTALRDQQVAQATVYRAVTLLTELGLLCRVQSREGELCYTAPPIGHSHPLICGVCRRVVRFEGDGDLRELEERLTAETGFSIYGHHLEVYGVCAACRAAGMG